MSELSKLTGAGNTTALPGYTLSPPGLRELGEAESEFARDYIASVAAGAKSADPEVRKELLAAATERVANSHFNYYGPGYRLCCLSARHLPFLLWLVARIESPKLTREQAKELITRDNEGDVSNAVLEALGFDTRPNVKAEKPESTPTSPSTGTPGGASSDSSATNENLATTKSAA
jgi:hypothetical protein